MYVRSPRIAFVWRRAISNRLTVVLLLAAAYRSCISRNYYAMYHGARAVVFGTHFGDDFEAHSALPRNLPSSLPSRVLRETELTDARLLRNQADYDSYPQSENDWEVDARQLGTRHR